MAAPGAPRAPTQTLPGCRKAQGQGEQAAWGATSGSLTHSPRPGSTKGMGGWSGPPPPRGQGWHLAAQGWGSSSLPMPQYLREGMPRGIPAWWETLSRCPVPLRRGELPCEGLLWEPPAATRLHTGLQVPPQPTCAAPGGGFRDWRSSSEHQFCDRGGLSGETNSCKRNQRGRALLPGKQ